MFVGPKGSVGAKGERGRRGSHGMSNGVSVKHNFTSFAIVICYINKARTGKQVFKE